MPKVVPPKGIPEYHSDQSRHEHLPSIPLRAVIAGPSGCGKTMLIVTMITDLYRKNDGKSVFKRIYVFSPSVHADPAWIPVKKFVKDEIKMPKDEEWAFDHYDPGALNQIILTQRAVIAAAKDRKIRKMFNILVIVDDFADNPAFSRHDALLHSLSLHQGSSCLHLDDLCDPEVPGSIEHHSSQRNGPHRLSIAFRAGAAGYCGGDLGSLS